MTGARASGSGLCGSATFIGGYKQSANALGRRIFCRWDGIPHDSITAIEIITTEHVPVRTATQLSKHIKRVIEVYGRAGFNMIRTILMDGEFEKSSPLYPI